MVAPALLLILAAEPSFERGVAGVGLVLEGGVGADETLSGSSWHVSLRQRIGLTKDLGSVFGIGAVFRLSRGFSATEGSLALSGLARVQPFERFFLSAGVGLRGGYPPCARRDLAVKCGAPTPQIATRSAPGLRELTHPVAARRGC